MRYDVRCLTCIKNLKEASLIYYNSSAFHYNKWVHTLGNLSFARHCMIDEGVNKVCGYTKKRPHYNHYILVLCYLLRHT